MPKCASGNGRKRKMQPDLFTPQTELHEQASLDCQTLMSHLNFHKTFRTRKQICEALFWTDRRLRDVAEQLGSDIIRCQAGFKLVAHFSRDDAPLVLQACDAFESQARKNLSYSTALRRRLHALIG